jgi:hypothetical protein
VCWQTIGHNFLELLVNYVELFFTGTAGNSLDTHNGRKFTTQDVDNDSSSTGNCAVVHHGAWWFRNCARSHLNGEYVGDPKEELRDGVFWISFQGRYYSYKIAEMKMGHDHNETLLLLPNISKL